MSTRRNISISCLATLFLTVLQQPLLAQTDLGPLNLPTTYVPLPFTENFETLAGTVPAHMAVTQIEVGTLVHDPDGWCNIGQLGPCLDPFSGSYNLEMGLNPSFSGYRDVRNALVIGLDGSGFTKTKSLSLQAIDYGDENNPVDGIWVSNDGSNWYVVAQNWAGMLPSLDAWDHLGLFFLDSTPVNTDGPFFLAFVQEDNYPYGYIDGIGVDDISIPGIPKPPVFNISNLVGGQYATMELTSDFPNRDCRFLVSLSGAGPTMFANVELLLSQPIHNFATVPTDNNGGAYYPVIVPLNLTGSSVWFQAVVVGQGEAWTSNGLAETVL